jgi:hypothetical protein
MVACLNFGCNPFFENGLGETPLSAARLFPNVDGANFEEYILQAIESWETQAINLQELMVPCTEYFVDFLRC